MSVFSKIKEAFVKSEDKDKYLSGLDRSKKSFGDRMRALSNNFHGIDDDLLEQIMVILLESDVGIHTAQKIVDAFESNGKHVKDYDSMLDYLISILYDFYDESSDEPIKMNEEGPTVILMVGVNGSGKTTTSAKLIQYYKEQGKKVAVAAADTFRAGAIDQIDTWANRLRFAKGGCRSFLSAGLYRDPRTGAGIYAGFLCAGVLYPISCTGRYAKRPAHAGAGAAIPLDAGR